MDNRIRHGDEGKRPILHTCRLAVSPQETCSAELLEEIEATFAAALRSVSAAVPGQDLRTRGWAPAEPLQAFLHAVERLTEMQGPRNHTVLMCAAPRGVVRGTVQ